MEAELIYFQMEVEKGEFVFVKGETKQMIN